MDEERKNEIIRDCLAAIEYIGSLGLSELFSQFGSSPPKKPPTAVKSRDQGAGLHESNFGANIRQGRQSQSQHSQTQQSYGQQSKAQQSRTQHSQSQQSYAQQAYPHQAHANQTQASHTQPNQTFADQAYGDQVHSTQGQDRRLASPQSNASFSADYSAQRHQRSGAASYGGSKVKEGGGLSSPFFQAKDITEFNQAVKECKNCFLGKSGAVPVIGRGPLEPAVMIVVEPPKISDPVVDGVPSGQALALLYKIISNGLKLKPQDCYITSIVKCQVEDPLNYDIQASKHCANIAFKEIALVKPKSLLVLGIGACQAICKKEDVMYRLRRLKTTLEPSNIPFRMTLGLSDMLEEPQLKHDVWQDLKSFIKEIFHK
ncbi:MAG: hypothetical protein LBT62_05895 [Deltaproteobacteria bacterium]|nr:hypothetical protein [Deltaproteobacteria bacterium]